MRHSPEPWSEDPEGEVAYGIEDRDGTHIADVFLTGGRLLLSEGHANVKLIKASPLLLKAAIMARNWIQVDGDTLAEMDEHDQAIYRETMEALRVAITEAKFKV